MDVLLGEEEARANHERLEWRELLQLYTKIQNNKGVLLIYYHLKTIPFTIIYNSTGAIVKNLASNVNLSYYMDVWALGSKLQKNYCWTFFQ